MITINLNQWYSKDDCDRLADALNAALATCCTEDPHAPPWF